MDKIYYVSLKNYVYDEDGNFIGIMEGNEINFDGEESEDNIQFINQFQRNSKYRN